MACCLRSRRGWQKAASVAVSDLLERTPRAAVTGPPTPAAHNSETRSAAAPVRWCEHYAACQIRQCNPSVAPPGTIEADADGRALRRL